MKGRRAGDGAHLIAIEHHGRGRYWARRCYPATAALYIGAKRYRVEIATTPDFSRTVERAETDATALAPTFQSGDWSKGGTYFRRVSAVDASGNSGNSTPVRAFRLRPLPST